MALKRPPVPLAVSNMEIAVKYLKDAARFYRSHAYKTGDRNRGRLIALFAQSLEKQLIKHYDYIQKSKQVPCREDSRL